MRWLAFVLAVCLTPTLGAQEQGDATDAADEEARIERALELRRELEELLTSLPPELRREVERRWREQRAVLAAEESAEPGPLASSPNPTAGFSDPSQLPQEPAATTAGSGAAMARPEPDEPSEAPAPQALPPAAPEGTAPPTAGPGEPRVETGPEALERSSEPPAAPAAPEPAEPAEPAPDQAPARAPSPPAEVTPPRPMEPREHVCDTLYAFDSNGDGVISGSDRFWRYLSLWSDDGDGVVEESELRSLFKHRIRKVDARLRGFTTTKEAEGGIWIEEYVYFSVPGRGPRSRAVLTLSAGDLGRSGDTWVANLEGTRLEGAVAIDRQTVLASDDGRRHQLLCR